MSDYDPMEAPRKPEIGRVLICPECARINKGLGLLGTESRPQVILADLLDSIGGYGVADILSSLEKRAVEDINNRSKIRSVQRAIIEHQSSKV